MQGWGITAEPDTARYDRRTQSCSAVLPTFLAPWFGLRFMNSHARSSSENWHMKRSQIMRTMRGICKDRPKLRDSQHPATSHLQTLEQPPKHIRLFNSQTSAAGVNHTSNKKVDLSLKWTRSEYESLGCCGPRLQRTSPRVASNNRPSIACAHLRRS